jgi:NTE family protein
MTAMNVFSLQAVFLLFSIAVMVNPAETRAEIADPVSRVGLVLSGGGARGAAHIGVLKVLEREGISVDLIAGTSMGALVGGLYAIGYSAEEIENIMKSQDWNSFFSDLPQRRLTPLIERGNTRYQGQLAFRGWNPELPGGLLGGQQLMEKLEILTTDRMLPSHYDFDRLPIPFRAVATNLIDGTPYVFEKGSMTEAIRASIGVPLLFTPLEKDGMLLVDGGLANNLPTDIARAMGADIIIAVDATTPLLAQDEMRSFFDVVDQAISLQMDRKVRENLNLADIVLTPELGIYRYNDYDKVRHIITKGEEAALRHLPELRELTAAVPARSRSEVIPAELSIIESISFHGLAKIPASQARGNIRVEPGDTVDTSAIVADVSRLYGTRLFESVRYDLEPLDDNRYHLTFVLKEAMLNTLGGGIRYDNDFTFVVLAELTARQIFNTQSKVTVSTRFGGREHHEASLRFIFPTLQFLFVEPKLEASRLERLDIRNQIQVDRFTDKRESGQMKFGGIIFRQLEIAGNYRYERVRASGGASEANRLEDSVTLGSAGLSLNWDSLDDPEHPRSGAEIELRLDKTGRTLGGDLDYSRGQADYKHYMSFSEKSTFKLKASAGYSHGPVPFFDLFSVGGYSFCENSSRQFLGLRRDEFLVRHMAILGAEYSRRLISRPLSMVRGAYLIGNYNIGYFSNSYRSPYEVSNLHGAGLGLSVDTVLGPLRTTLGWAEGGRFNFYFSFGPAF